MDSLVKLFLERAESEIIEAEALFKIFDFLSSPKEHKKVYNAFSKLTQYI